MKHLDDSVARPLLATIAFSAIGSLVLIAVFIFKEGVPFMARVGLVHFLCTSDWHPESGQFGILPMIVASLLVTVGAMLLGAPLGVAGAVFLCEFVPPTVMRVIKPAIELLAAIPSVVYGFIGVMVLAPLIRAYGGGPGLCLLNAVIVLGIMVLPTVISISTDAIMAVPNSYREGARALGATRWQAVHMVVLKAARSGIVASIILGMGRAVGETMAVIMVAGNTAQVPHSAFDPVCTLTAKIAMEMSSAVGLHRQSLFAIGVVLFVVIMCLNALATTVIRQRKKTA
jgi:phosphate ABC transporter permease protein PstC